MYAHREADSASSSRSGNRDAAPERQRRAQTGYDFRRPSGARASQYQASGFARLLPLALVFALLLGIAGYLLADPPHSDAPVSRIAQADTAALRASSSISNALPNPATPSGGMDESLSPGRAATTLLVVLGLILAQALFATAEVALFTVGRARLRQLVEEGDRRAQNASRLLEEPWRVTATTQTGAALVGTLAMAITAVVVVRPLQLWLTAHLPGSLWRVALPLSLLLTLVPVALLALTLGGIVPKGLGVRHAERIALASANLVRGLQIALAPLVALATTLASLVLKPFGGTATFLTPTVNEEELRMMVEAGQEQGVLEAGETEMIQSVLTLSDTVVRKVMTPRMDMTGVEVDASLSELVQRVNESGHSRIPIYEEDLDNVVGIVHAKDLLSVPYSTDRDAVATRTLMRPAYFIPETKKVDELLTEFRRGRQQIAIVRDEYGTTTGLVTMEDLVEEIVGDIQDEYDNERSPFEVLDANTCLLDGRLALSDVNERMGLSLPEDEADTVGGFVFNLLGHRAMPGERAEWQGLTFVVDATDGRRITQVRLCRNDSGEDTIATSSNGLYAT